LLSWETHLDEGQRVNLVLAGDLNACGLGLLDVVAGLDTGLNCRIDLVVVQSAQDVEVVGTSRGQRVLCRLVAESDAVSGQGCLLHIVCSFSANEETLVGSNTVDAGDDGAGRWSEVTEGADVGGTLLEVQIDGLALVEAFLGVEVGDDLCLEAIGGDIFELDLGGNEAGSGVCEGRGGALSKDLLRFQLYIRELSRSDFLKLLFVITNTACNVTLVRVGAFGGEVEAIGILELHLERRWVQLSVPLSI